MHTIIQLALKYIKYNPNYDDGDEDMESEDEDAGEDMEEVEEEDECVLKVSFTHQLFMRFTERTNTGTRMMMTCLGKFVAPAASSCTASLEHEPSFSWTSTRLSLPYSLNGLESRRKVSAWIL